MDKLNKWALLKALLWEGEAVIATASPQENPSEEQELLLKTHIQLDADVMTFVARKISHVQDEGLIELHFGKISAFVAFLTRLKLSFGSLVGLFTGLITILPIVHWLYEGYTMGFQWANYENSLPVVSLILLYFSPRLFRWFMRQTVQLLWRLLSR
ncbi:hypothetical protein AAG747_10125 [Rapidithrix thailandica]|uniref:Uncharacterized protein n=1 Tax=Rapidithrix thailandica TaxID=413964 RepID=A0AAW9RU28_9BACT